MRLQFINVRFHAVNPKPLLDFSVNVTQADSELSFISDYHLYHIILCGQQIIQLSQKWDITVLKIMFGKPVDFWGMNNILFVLCNLYSSIIITWARAFLISMPNSLQPRATG